MVVLAVAAETVHQILLQEQEIVLRELQHQFHLKEILVDLDIQTHQVLILLLIQVEVVVQVVPEIMQLQHQLGLVDLEVHILFLEHQ
jgi:hypothetical protein